MTDRIYAGHWPEDCPERIEVQTWAMNPNDPEYVHGACEQMKLGDINKECTCGGHSDYCKAKDTAKPVVVIMDPDFYMELRQAVQANGAEKLKLVIDSIASEE